MTDIRDAIARLQPALVETVARALMSQFGVGTWEQYRMHAERVISDLRGAGALVGPGEMPVKVERLVSLVRHEVLPALKPGNVSLRAEIERLLPDA